MRNIFLLSLLVIMIFSSSVFTQELNQSNVSTQDKMLLLYNTDIFDDDTKSWQYFSIEYQFRKTFATFIPRVNFANRFTKSEIQFEADAYVLLSKKLIYILTLALQKEKFFLKLEPE